MSTKTKKNGSFLSTSEVSELLGCCRQTTSKLPIPRFEYNGLIRYHADDIAKFIEANKH